jgi:hypothetical protein
MLKDYSCIIAASIVAVNCTLVFLLVARLAAAEKGHAPETDLEDE